MYNALGRRKSNISLNYSLFTANTATVTRRKKQRFPRAFTMSFQGTEHSLIKKKSRKIIIKRRSYLSTNYNVFVAWKQGEIFHKWVIQTNWKYALNIFYFYIKFTHCRNPKCVNFHKNLNLFQPLVFIVDSPDSD